ncbi:MAG: GNAT family N-acetyltransferase [Candidatus Nanopelagicales bacterium]
MEASERLGHWGPACLPDLIGLWSQCLPTDPIAAEDLRRVITDDAGVVLGSADGKAAVSVLTRRTPAGPAGFIRLLLVAPQERRRRRATALLDAAEDWLAAQGASTVQLGGEFPEYLWPGVDMRNVGTQALAQQCGYRATGGEITMNMPTEGFRAPPPNGVTVRTVSAADRRHSAALELLVTSNWPHWLPVLRRAVERGTITGAFVTRGPGQPDAVGFAAHSAVREGWLGPVGTAPDHAGRGIAAATISGALADLRARGVRRTEVAWMGIPGYFADRGADFAHGYLHLGKDLSPTG